ncbi:putative transcription factor bZIP family [Lupinus albus]|uniref:Putative transcription factor bZIP family n=1 Tax=Lupinus albus TaxID=3870 RepID=A0A6A4PYJ3_LUPAL|nr:putative transcription factor bZIP family [Lupinus albus]
MEEVWKDINLACLNEHNTRPTMSTRGSTFGGVIFQDFLSIVPSSNTCSNFSSSNSCSLYSTAPPTPVTALSLSCSPPEFLFDTSMDSHLVHHQYPNPNPNVTKVTCYSTTTTTPPFERLNCTVSLPCFETKGFTEPPNRNRGERKNKRMIKNRESAARSRARKQAYTKELQLKVERLMEENARLKSQQQQSYEVAASQQKKKNTLYRTSTAPF